MVPVQFNYGKLRQEITPEKNIVYYRRGLEELSLNITNSCPNACTFCIRDRNSGWGVSNLYLERDPSIGEIISSFDLASKRGEEEMSLKKVKICGYGEPILRFLDLFPITEYIRQKYPSIDIQLATTGWPYFRFISSNADLLKKLRKSGMNQIFLSLNATNEADYNRLIRPGVKQLDKNAFSDAIQFAMASRDAGYNTVLGFVKLPGMNAESDVANFAGKLKLNFKLREFEN